MSYAINVDSAFRLPVGTKTRPGPAAVEFVCGKSQKTASSSPRPGKDKGPGEREPGKSRDGRPGISPRIIATDGV